MGSLIFTKKMKILKANVCTILIVGLFAHPWVISRDFERYKNVLANKDRQKLIYLENDDVRYPASDLILKLLQSEKSEYSSLELSIVRCCSSSMDRNRDVGRCFEVNGLEELIFQKEFVHIYICFRKNKTFLLSKKK